MMNTSTSRRTQPTRASRDAAAPARPVEALEGRVLFAGTGLAAQYFDNADFTEPRLSRLDPVVHFKWGRGSPDPSVGADTFSVVWTGQVEAPRAGTYTFRTRTNDAVRLTVDGREVLQRSGTSRRPRVSLGRVALEAGRRYDIRMEFVEQSGGARAKLMWSSAGQRRQVIPTEALYPHVLPSGDHPRPDAPTPPPPQQEDPPPVQVRPPAPESETPGQDSGAPGTDTGGVPDSGQTTPPAPPPPPPSGSVVVGRHIVYHHDAIDAAAAAVAPDKQGLLPGGRATAANYTSVNRGIEGIAMDVAGLPAAGAGLSLDDFAFRVGGGGGGDADPAGWAAAPQPESITVRAGAGAGGTARVTVLWPDHAARNAWLQVTVLANADTGLAAPDVFYLGNLVGDADGSGTVDVVDFGALREEFGRADLPAAGGRSDFNRDGRVNLADFGLIRQHFGLSLPAPSAADGDGGE